MEGLFALLFLLFGLSILLLLLGLLRPSLVLHGRTLTRVRAVQIYGGLALLSLVLMALFMEGFCLAFFLLATSILPLMLIAGLIHPPLVLPSDSSRKRVVRVYLLLILFFLALGIPICKLPTQQAIAPTPPPQSAVSSAPTATPASEPAPEVFQAAVRYATEAAELSQSALISEEWNDISTHWQEASILMGNIPSTSSYYTLAQNKSKQYATNADLARKKSKGLAPRQSPPTDSLLAQEFPQSNTSGTKPTATAKLPAPVVQAETVPETPTIVPSENVVEEIPAPEPQPQPQPQPSAPPTVSPIREGRSGSCTCPYDTDSAGRRCGKRSAYSRRGGAKPLCYIFN